MAMDEEFSCLYGLICRCVASLPSSTTALPSNERGS